MKDKSRYATDWDAYSESWKKDFGGTYEHLGDEWNDDGTRDRRRDTFYYRVFAERWLTPESTVLEIGPGSGKWTVRMAPNVKRVIAIDVSDKMLERTRARCKQLGITNVEYVLTGGEDFGPVADGSIDFFFSFDVFVHIALEDTFPYAHEMARVLRPGGRGVCHYAVNSLPEAWDRIELNNSWYKGGAHTLGQYYYFSPEMLRRMYERCGLRVVEMHQEWVNCKIVFEKPLVDVVTRLESLLWELLNPGADDDARRERCCKELQAMPDRLREAIGPLVEKIRTGEDLYARSDAILQLRRIWRGL